MIARRHPNISLSLFIVISILWGARCSLASTQDWSEWFGQFIGVTQSTISDDADKNLHSQDNITHRDSLNSELPDWLTVSAYFDSAYRNTNFYDSGHHTVLSQGDSRIEFWIPPGRESFSWGPYIRFAGLTSDHSQAWENAWLAKPGFGFQAYPFSAPDFRNNNQKAAEILGPLRLFAEKNRMDYWGSENVWRPDKQVRVGAEYWRQRHVNKPTKRTWSEIWTGLIWQSANEFDKDYDTLIFANAVRLGFREPNTGIASTLTPYLTMESSLTENGAYYWENKLLLGGGIRFAPLLYERKGESNWLTRFVVYAEYLGVAAYYRDSAPSSVPDYDFRVGISLSTGEWFR